MATHTPPSDVPNTTQAPTLELRGISKAFGAVQAVENVTLTLRSGEVLALVGDNGAGKSTLMKIVAGAVSADSGDLFLNGQKVAISDPADAREVGIEMIYQDLALFDNLDVAGNIFINREKTVFHPVMDRKSMWKRAEELVSSLKVNIPSARSLVARMSGGQRQMVAVARALAFGSKLLIMDEPNAALGVTESQAVLDTIRNLKGDHSIFLITQRIPDVMKVADRVAVLKGGRLQDVLKVEDTNQDEIAELIIVGRDESDRDEDAANEKT